MCENFLFTNIIAFILGCIASVFATLIFLRLQFFHSIAGKRFAQIEKATKEIVSELDKKNDVGPLRNRYRASLGVLIDNLWVASKDGNNKWPNLIGISEKEQNEKTEKDRWGKFYREVRPVLSDLSPYLVLGLRWCKIPFCRLSPKLEILTDLLFQVEVCVGELDKAYEDDSKRRKGENCYAGALKIDSNPNSNLIFLENFDNQNDLNKDRQRLLDCWSAWRDVVGLNK